MKQDCSCLFRHKNKLIDRYGCEKSKNRRCPHYYFINGNKSILIILQGDITRTRVDAIVNGLFIKPKQLIFI